MVLDRDIVVTVNKGRYKYSTGDKIEVLSPRSYNDTWQIGISCPLTNKYTYLHYETHVEAMVAYENLKHVLKDTNFNKIHQDGLLVLYKDIQTPEDTLKPSAIKMLASYMSAITKCGGAVDSFIEDIDTMTVAEMISILGPNGVRFTYKT